MIKVENLKKSFGENDVLKNINAIVSPREVVVVIGPSGSGKSTFLRCINQLETITGGHIFIEGLDTTDKKVNINKVRTEVGMVFQHFNLFPHKTVLENIMLAPIKVRKISKEQASQRGMELLKKVGNLQRKRTHIRIHYQGDKSNASQLQGRWRWNPKSCYSTSPLPPWIRKWSVKSLRS